jgi:hypothetical protein
MFRFLTAILIVPVITSAAPVIAADSEVTRHQEPTDWATKFRGDLQAARRIILESHPGPVDVLNPGFRDWLDAGFEQQMALAGTVDTADEYVYAIQKYVGGFRDGHLNIRFDVERRPARWPGFLATWRNDEVVVHTVGFASHSGLAEGDRLRSCDGQTAEQLIRQRVFDFQFNPALPAQWVPAAARTFLDLGNPFVHVPTRCVFARGEREIALDLEWRKFSWDDHRDDYKAAQGRTRPEVGLFVPENGVYWLQASTFGPNESQVKVYHDAFGQLRKARNDAELVVLDLRGNDGGSSMWGNLFAEALWDELPGDDEKDSAFVEWRVSGGNIDYWEEVPARVSEQFGHSHFATRWANHVLQHLTASLSEGRSLWRESPVEGELESNDDSTAEHAGASIPRYTGPVVVLTDTTCGSACLDAMSLLTQVPEVIHVGSVTAADTEYMESRPAPLPSGLATLVIPIKVYRGRVRPDGGYFTPSIPFDGLHWTDEALKAWVLGLWRDGSLETNAHAH